MLLLLFAHPLYWWLRGRIRDDQEAVADAVAARESPHDYAQELLNWVRRTEYRKPMRAVAAVGVWESRWQLSRRIAMLLDETFCVQTAVSRRWKCRAVGLLMLVGAALSLVTLQPSRSVGQQDASAAQAGVDENKNDGVGKTSDSAGIATAESKNSPATAATIAWCWPERIADNAHKESRKRTADRWSLLRRARTGCGRRSCHALLDRRQAPAKVAGVPPKRGDGSGRKFPAFAPVAAISSSERCEDYAVIVTATGRATATIADVSQRRFNNLHLVMPEAGLLRGRIAGPNGRPVEGAVVWVPLAALAAGRRDQGGQDECQWGI